MSLRSATSSELASVLCSSHFESACFEHWRARLSLKETEDTSLFKSIWLEKDAVPSVDCAAVVHVCIVPFRRIRYLTLSDLNTSSQSTSSYTQLPRSSALLAWIQAPDMFGYKNIKHFRFLLSIKQPFPCFLTKTTLLIIISEVRSTKSHKNIIYENLFHKHFNDRDEL